MFSQGKQASIISTWLVIACLYSCAPSSKELPILGKKEDVDGQTIHHTIPDFEFINQDSMLVTPATFSNQVYVADFFFTSCPTICPVMTQQMLRIHNHFKDNDQVALLSHSIDTKRDSVPTLKKYAEGIGVSSPKWHFVTGQKDAIYDIADAYFNIVIEDETLPGGYDHSGRFILVDENRHVRSYCLGTNKDEVSRFIEDIEQLVYAKK